MPHRTGLRNFSENTQRTDLHALLQHGNKMPLFLRIQVLHLLSARNKISARLIKLLKRPLYTVKHISDNARRQIHGKRLSCRFYRLTGLQAGGAFIDLNRCFVSVHADDLSDQADRSNVYHILHGKIVVSFGLYNRTIYTRNIFHCFLPSFITINCSTKGIVLVPSKHRFSWNYRSPCRW